MLGPHLRQETQLSLKTARLICANAIFLRADLLKDPSPYVSPCRIWSFCVKKCRHKIYRKKTNWGALELRSVEMGGVADPKIHAPTCYHVKFGSSATKGIQINRREPKKMGALGPAAWDGGVADL